MNPAFEQLSAVQILRMYKTVIVMWNAQADEHSQWADLGEDEKIAFAMVCAVGWGGLNP